MVSLGFALVLLWGFLISGTVLSVLLIDSYDCSKFEHGWDKICLDTNEIHKSHVLRTMPIAGIIFSALFIIVIPRKTSNDESRGGTK